jgi:antitoxin MazE
MIKTLTRHGNSLSLVIDRAVLDLLSIDADTPLDITTDGHALIVTPIRYEARREQFQRALRSVNRRYGQMLKRLAN